MDAREWIYRFGDVEVEPAAHRITRDGADLAVEPKAFAVLVALLEQHGKALERDALLDRVWGHRHVTPGVLNRVVVQLRKALGDSAEHPRYIQTLHGLGYRFIGEVEQVAAAATGSAGVEAAPPDVADAAATDALPATAMAARPTRRFVLAAALAAVLVVAAIVLGWMQRPSPARPEASVAVLPFTSLSSRPEDSYFAEGLAVEMHDALAGVQGLTVAARMTATDADGRDANVKAIGRQLGVATVLDASVRREGERLRINARLSDCTTGYTLWSRSYDRELSDVFATQSEIANDVVTSLIGVIPDADALRKRLTPTTNVAAFDAYLKGMNELRKTGREVDTKVASMFFGQALAADRGFARAQAGTCRAKLLEFEKQQDAGIFEAAQAACLRASEMDPELRETSLALGDLHRIRGDFGKAVEHYMRAQEDPALKPAAYLGMGRVQSAKGRQDLALGYFERALKLRPNDAAIHRQVGFQHYRNGNLSGAIEFYRNATSLEPGNADAWASLGALYLNDGNNSAAARAFGRSIGIEPTAIAMTNLGLLKYSNGDYAAAAGLFRRATTLEPGDFRHWGALGEALLEIPGGAKQAREPFLRAARMAEDYVKVKADDAHALALLAWYRAHLGEAAAARELAARAEALGTGGGEVALRNAETFAFLGDAKSAHERLARARQAGIPEKRIAASVVLRRLPETTDAGTGNSR